MARDLRARRVWAGMLVAAATCFAIADAKADTITLKNGMILEGTPSTIGSVAADPLKGDRQSGLTPRELQVLQLICDGKSNREIAAALELSVNTVAVHRANIMQTFGIHNTAELVVYAIRRGLVSIA